MNKSILIKLVDWICDGYLDTLVTGIEENEHYFPYTIALIHFIDELQRKCIKVNYNELVNDSIIDNVLKEANDYLARQVYMKSKIFGYARVSSKEQNEERQLVTFKEYGIDERDIYIDIKILIEKITLH